MVTFRETAKNLKDIPEIGWKILYLIEKDINRFERYPLNILYKRTKIDIKKLVRYIKELSKYGLVEYSKYPYDSVKMLAAGADALALRILAKKNLVVGIGRQIGIGKESDVYEALGPNNEKYSIKVFRLGRISFRDVTRKRSYYNVHDRSKVNWIVRNYRAAAKEFSILEYLYSKNISVPKPITNVKHIIVMNELKGCLLTDLDYIDDPKAFFDKIIDEVKKTFNAGIINADLSPFNIFVTDDMKPVLIDWPQAVKTDAIMWKKMLERDINNVISYFEKKFSIKADSKEVFGYITSE